VRLGATICAAIAGAASVGAALAFTVEPPPAAAVIQRGKVVVIQLGSDYFTVTTVPPDAAQLEFLPALPPAYARDDAAALDPGSHVAPTQVTPVLEAYFKDSAIDFESIRIRHLQIDERGYAAWCTNPTIFGCAYRELRAGTPVRFEVNGRNRVGGMTGFEPRIFMIRRRGWFWYIPLPNDVVSTGVVADPDEVPDDLALNGMEDIWILRRLAETARDATKELEAFQFGELSRKLRDFTWNDFCDWYVEFSKGKLRSDMTGWRSGAQRTLVFVLDGLCRLLHPIMPFVTEQVWQALNQVAPRRHDPALFRVVVHRGHVQKFGYFHRPARDQVQ